MEKNIDIREQIQTGLLDLRGNGGVKYSDTPKNRVL